MYATLYKSILVFENETTLGEIDMTSSSTFTSVAQSTRSKLSTNPLVSTPPIKIPSKASHQGRVYTRSLGRTPDLGSILASTPPNTDDLGDYSEGSSMKDSHDWDDLSVIRSPEKDSEAISATWFQQPSEQTINFFSMTSSGSAQREDIVTKPTLARTDPIEAAKSLISGHSKILADDQKPAEVETFVPSSSPLTRAPANSPTFDEFKEARMNPIHPSKTLPTSDSMTVQTSGFASRVVSPSTPISAMERDFDSAFLLKNRSKSFPTILPSHNRSFFPSSHPTSISLPVTPKNGHGPSPSSTQLLPINFMEFDVKPRHRSSTPHLVPLTPLHSPVPLDHHKDVAVSFDPSPMIHPLSFARFTQIALGDDPLSLPGRLILDESSKPDSVKEASPKKLPQQEKHGLGAGVEVDQRTLDRLGIPPAIELTDADLEDPQPQRKSGPLLDQLASPSSRVAKFSDPFPSMSPTTSRLTIAAPKKQTCKEWFQSAKVSVRKSMDHLSCKNCTCCECAIQKKDS